MMSISVKNKTKLVPYR